METTTTTLVYALTGKITLQQPAGQSCGGTGGYDDIRAGANIVVRDGDGSVIGTGVLGVGEKIQAFEETDLIKYCEFPIDVELARSADFYTVEIAGREGPVYSHSQMEEMAWVVELVIG